MPADPSRTSPASADLEVSFLVPLYNCLALTQAMLVSLRTHLPAGLSHEIILADDGSTDGTRAWLGTLAGAGLHVLLNDRNLGYAATMNRAAARARGSQLVLLNSDLEFTSGWLEPMRRVHAMLGPRAGVIGNVQLGFARGELDHAGIVIEAQGKPEHLRTWPAVGRREQPFEVPAVTAACALLSRSLWQDLGGFDEAYLNGGEDIDLCFRARAAGRRNAVALRSTIRHHVSASPGRKRHDERNSYRLMLRWHREFAACATGPTRAWCRAYLAEQWADPRTEEAWTVLEALRHAAGLGAAPVPARRAIEEAQLRELARWQAMFPETAPLPGPPHGVDLHE